MDALRASLGKKKPAAAAEPEAVPAAKERKAAKRATATPVPTAVRRARGKK